jgi:UDP-glucuronate 4-epimerase
MEKIIVTGACGFIGMHTCISLLKKKNINILGLDNLNNYYDINLKLKRNVILSKYKNYKFKKIDICNKKAILNIFKNYKPKYVIHLAAQAGVRYSFISPVDYNNSNLLGFLNILEACVTYNVKHLTYASSSSVYGANKKIPFAEEDHVNHPLSYYAATKRANELMAHVYSSAYNLPTTGLRFFTVYGPWGRPDMAYFLCAKAIIEKKSINLHEGGNMLRDFTYIDDAVKVIKKVYKKIPKKNQIIKNNNSKLNSSSFNFLVLNVGSHKPVKVITLVKLLEKEFKSKLDFTIVPVKKGELMKTYAATKMLKKYINAVPNTRFEKGIHKFANWFKHYIRMK